VYLIELQTTVIRVEEIIVAEGCGGDRNADWINVKLQGE
jgi:hypothetical protein